MAKTSFTFLGSRLPETFNDEFKILGVFFLVGLGVLFYYALFPSLRGRRGYNAPVAGQRSYFEPGWLLGLRFVHGSGSIIRDGYEKFKNSMFQIRRNDANILIISNKYIEQLRNLPEEEISPIKAHIKNLLGHVSTTDILLHTNIHTRTLQHKLTPSLALVIPIMKEELDYALGVELPRLNDKWAPISMYNVLLKLIARTSARVFIGLPECRNEEWLSISIHYTENVFITAMKLRALPRYWHHLIAPFLPSYWRVHANLRAAKRIIGPLVRERYAARIKNQDGLESPDDFLQWMIEEANESESRPETMAHIQLVITLAAIHTTGMAATHAVYDLCAHPEYFQLLREELKSVLHETGGWHKTTLTKLKKMDSFLRESQRMSPPSQLAFNRIVQKDLELSDGIILPTGTHFAMASDAILHDQVNIPGGGDPECFDGFRYVKLREDPAHPENCNRFQFATTDNNSLHFGHGKYACPGRFFATNEIKMILGHLLLKYDFKYPSGQGRPPNMSADENIFPDPGVKVLIRGTKDAAD